MEMISFKRFSDLPINKLLPMSLAYGDAVGNARNL
jgi:hypothetical protein